jgi:hypothetical protein
MKNDYFSIGTTLAVIRIERQLDAVPWGLPTVYTGFPYLWVSIAPWQGLPID